MDFRPPVNEEEVIREYTERTGIPEESVRNFVREAIHEDAWDFANDDKLAIEEDLKQFYNANGPVSGRSEREMLRKFGTVDPNDLYNRHDNEED